MQKKEISGNYAYSMKIWKYKLFEEEQNEKRNTYELTRSLLMTLFVRMLQQMHVLDWFSLVPNFTLSIISGDMKAILRISDFEKPHAHFGFFSDKEVLAYHIVFCFLSYPQPTEE